MQVAIIIKAFAKRANFSAQPFVPPDDAQLAKLIY